ncbi:MAG: HD domain-containing protein [Muribaculaceae bacterium]|nr:HD domain-containing protein [Muribaculaceae bacterium]
MGFFAKLFGIKKHHVYYTDDYDLPENEINDNKSKIISLLRGTNRAGVEKVISYLDKNQYFIIPATIHHHHRGKGGLAQHSLEVLSMMKSRQPEDVTDDSLIIAALLHDVCKTERFQYNKHGGLSYVHGKGHGRGRKSIRILQNCGLDITETERRAIRWHLGGNNADIKDLQDVTTARMESLWKILFDADRINSDR